MATNKKIQVLRYKLRNDPLKFVKLFADVDPLPYQEEFLKDNSHYQIFVGGRRVGKSYMVSMKALHFAWTHPMSLVLIVSASKEQAAETFRYIKDVVNKSAVLSKTVLRSTQSELEFDNHSRIKVVPAGESGKSVRGYTADMVIIDEAAYVPEDVFTAIEPTIATQIKKGSGYFILVGSPAEPTGYFYKAWTSEGWSKHHARTMDNPYVDENYPKQFRERHSEADYKREILGEFAAVDDTFFDIDAVLEVATGIPQDKPSADYDYYFGLDVAYTGNDETALVIVGINKRIENPKIEMVQYYTVKKKPPTWTVWWVSEMVNKWNPKQVYVDATTYGYAIYELLRERLGDKAHIVRGINFSTKERDEMFMFLRKLIEDKEIVLLNDSKVTKEFMSYIVKVRANGDVRIAKKKHSADDITDALALAVWGVKKGGVNYVYMSNLKVDDIFPHRRMNSPYFMFGMGGSGFIKL